VHCKPITDIFFLISIPLVQVEAPLTVKISLVEHKTYALYTSEESALNATCVEPRAQKQEELNFA
jgi:hypothetical protein